MAEVLRRLRALIAVVFARGGMLKVTLHGRPAWVHLPSLRVLPAVSGADGADDADADTDADGDADADADTDKDKDADGDADADKGADADADKDGAGGRREPNWKAEARKHERRLKAERKAREEAETKLREREAADMSEQEKAVAEAREAGKAEALTESQKERRADRLEVAVTRLAARGITVKDGDKEKVVKFADPEDALVFIERALAKGDLDDDDVFDDDGKVKVEAVTEELTDLLARKPRLAAAEAGGGGSPAGDGDGGKGKGGGKGIEDMSVAEHVKRMAKG